MSGDREHKYPQRFPKDDPRASVRIAWEILDSVRPGVIPPIVRFRLAEQIANACSALDDVQKTTIYALELRDFFIKMRPEIVVKIAELSPELIMHLSRLAAYSAPANENEIK